MAARVVVHRDMEVGWPRLATGQYRASVDRASMTVSCHLVNRMDHQTDEQVVYFL